MAVTDHPSNVQENLISHRETLQDHDKTLTQRAAITGTSGVLETQATHNATLYNTRANNGASGVVESTQKMSGGYVSPSLSDIFSFGTGTSGSVYYKRWTGSAWSDWTNIGGIAETTPNVTYGPGNRIDVTVIGTDKAMWHKAAVVDSTTGGITWSSWQSLGGQFDEY